FEFIDLCRSAQTEVECHIVLRTKHRAAQNILSLPHRARRHVSYASDRIARTLLRHVADQSQAQPVAIRSRDIAQHNRLRIEIIDHEIKPAITVEIADRESTTRPRIRERTARRRADTLKLSLQITKEQRLLRVTRSPLMLISRRINVTIHNKQIKPAIVVEINKTRAPTEKRNRHFTKSHLERHIGKVVVAIVVIQRV